jgi:methylmalonyl-CoA/ethylmalonyl-CoA epimerase
MTMKLAHIGVAVRNLETSSKLFASLFATTLTPPEVVGDQRVRISMVNMTGASVELTEPTAPDSPIGKFLAKRGEGIHHLSFEVEDLAAELARLKDLGFELIDESPRRGSGGHLIAFLHPKSTNGILIELTQLLP